ncbi:hypothetical protein D3C87_1308150 [compost metagenome]
MHHERFVEAVTIQLPGATVLHVNHRRLAERREQFVGGMGGEHQRAIVTAGRAHAVTPGEKLMERRVGVPGLIEMQHLDAVAQLLLDQLGVVTEAVIGRIGHYRELDLGCSALGQRAGIDLGLDRLRAEFAQGNRADDAQLITLRAQVQRNGAGHDDRVQHRLVAIAVHQHQVIARHHGVPDDLVGGRGAVDDEEGMVGAEVARRPSLGFRQWPGVIQ